MDKIRGIWNKYQDWLGDKVWYKNWRVWLSVIVVLGIAGAFVDDDAEAEAEEPETEEVAKAEEDDTEEKVTEDTADDEEEVEKEPEEELSTQEIIKNAIKDQFDNKLIDVEYMEETDHYNVYVELSNISVGMDKNSANVNTYELLEKIQNEELNSIFIEFEGEFVDDYGNVSENRALAYDISKETIDKINFDNFQINKLPDVADSYWEHPAYR